MCVENAELHGNWLRSVCANHQHKHYTTTHVVSYQMRNLSSLSQLLSYGLAGAVNLVAEPLLRHLKLHSATSRITAALTVTAWLHALQQQGGLPPSSSTSSLPPGPTPTPQAPSVPQDIVLALFGCLAQPAAVVTAEAAIQPYAELAPVYSAMQKQAQVHKHRRKKRKEESAPLGVIKGAFVPKSSLGYTSIEA